MSFPPERGLLEELLSAHLGRAAFLQRIMEYDSDPYWIHEFEQTKQQVAEVQERLRRFG